MSYVVVTDTDVGTSCGEYRAFLWGRGGGSAWWGAGGGQCIGNVFHRYDECGETFVGRKEVTDLFWAILLTTFINESPIWGGGAVHGECFSQVWWIWRNYFCRKEGSHGSRFERCHWLHLSTNLQSCDMGGGGAWILFHDVVTQSMWAPLSLFIITSSLHELYNPRCHAFIVCWIVIWIVCCLFVPTARLQAFCSQQQLSMTSRSDILDFIWRGCVTGSILHLVSPWYCWQFDVAHERMYIIRNYTILWIWMHKYCLVISAQTTPQYRYCVHTNL